MAILDKIFFWRKKEEPAAPAPGGEKSSLGLPGEEELGLKPATPEGFEEPAAAGLAPRGPAPHEAPGPMPGREPPEAPQPSPAAMPPGYAPQPSPQMTPPMAKDLEVISAKLDALKSSLDTLNQRIANLERMASGEHESY